MPLPPAAPRRHIHTRTIVCEGHLRDDGLWDIEGHLRDTKSYAFKNRERGGVAAGEPIHEMWLRLTVDDTLTIRDAEAATDHSPYAVCRAAPQAYKRLVGLSIGPGWRRAIREAIRTVDGCTHLTELLGPVATTAFQTIVPYLYRTRDQKVMAQGQAPRLLDTCHAYRADGPKARELWPEHYTGA